MLVKQRIAALLARLNDGVYEKEEEMGLSLLSSLAGESVFLLGPPGVAKSLIARRLKFAYTGGSSFEYLMSRFSTPDEIFGPVSISRLKNNDKYERLTENYLPSATVVFLDEIWKAGPSIQNALLTVLNERVYRNGEQEIHVPMKALISASNELPEKERGLEALWDRFLVRVYVGGVRDKALFNAMISGALNCYEDTLRDEEKITDDEYRSWSAAIDEVRIPENIFGVIDVIRNYIEQHNQKEENAQNRMYISDRRWRKIARLLRASAFLNDRREVDLMDCFLIRHCIWHETLHIEPAAVFVREAVEKHGYAALLRFKEIKEELADFQKEIAEATRAGAGDGAAAESGTAGTAAAGGEEYCEVLEYPNSRNDAVSHKIRAGDFFALSDTDRVMTLFYRHNATGQIMHTEAARMRKGGGQKSVLINGREYSVQISATENGAEKSRKPLPRVEEAWDGRINQFLKYTRGMREQVETLRKKEAANLSDHLFVPPEAAGSVEVHLSMLRKDIEKLELEIRGLRNSYKKIRDDGSSDG
ncbi:MAG: AAA family ATPase [Spirochaetales bacterium]|jgi:MoxR-like ATPase|nr:AAA family ATPase [Spirochaetales bacterium]